MKKLVQIRRKTPLFRRQEFHRWFGNRKKDDTWRKPKGHHGRVKRLSYQKGASPNVGYGTPSATRGMHPGGLVPVMVYNEKTLESINKEKQGILIGNVGIKKKIMIINEAMKKNIKILNLRKPEEFLQKFKIKGIKKAPEKKEAGPHHSAVVGKTGEKA